MARPETESKTIFGKRLRYVRLALGDPSRETLAKSFSMTKNSIAFYERGEREPNLSVLQTYRTLYGVNINWLLTGQGKMFDAEYTKGDFDWNYFIKKIEGLEETLTKCDRNEKPNQEKIDSSYEKLQQYLSRQGLSNGLNPKTATSLIDMKAKMANSYTLSLFIDLLIRSVSQKEVIANQ
ncbi:helix-turn-helix domain-containing protein [Bartonella krasnovii]|uniref:Helix-turn-helix domain-containing protein n=1 Tax=Bartonella krasnovii TaxID=2267275 RepID=A0A5B9D1Y3_9HYPH|nr:helix-turn-helix transcriptional regulator [Bartonella krasnovii]QEE12488.1 helix-turn-helix transcriptional regulator [Bartonella krasnovii]UNF28581.1 helix-turn-helix domain-containing protein [Bartonella krasnovii]UNF34959.1 helix-turn-helix domain-containing protein [Bartonella krasnovii]UNF36596.1 helix-turn-helix domain-containing protein [Bartonella krasnovii]UNF38229.1 helix-turn-helix domain-containing protein [Bartonella krasnovii]